MKLITFILIMLSTFAFADEKQDATDAIAIAKKHMVALITADTETLRTTMAESVQLMPGHEFSKAEYKLAGENGRATGAKVKREALLKVLLVNVSDRPAATLERVKAKLAKIKYTVIASKTGEVITDSSDPVATADGKLHFLLKEGDFLIKGTPERGDFVLLQLRKVDKSWKVVAEYLD